MREIKDKEVLDLLDGLDPHQALNIPELEDWNPKAPLANDTLARIRQKTMLKAKIPQRRNKLKLWVSVAAAFLIVFIGIMSYGPALARVTQLLQYIPGFGIVLEESDQRYILLAPVQQSVGAGMIRVEGVFADNTQTVVRVTGKDIPKYLDIVFVDKSGKEYSASTYSVVSTGSGIWQGSYSYNGSIPDPSDLTMILKGSEQVAFNLHLEIATPHSDYSQLGPTSQANGITITAITRRVGDLLAVNFVTPPLEDGLRISSYWEGISLIDDDGNEWPLVKPETHWQSTNEVFFDIQGSTAQEFKLTIPQLELQYQVNTSIRVPVPRKGIQEVNQSVELAGFPVVITKVERLKDDELQVYTDTFYSDTAEEFLKYVMLKDVSWWIEHLNQEQGYMESIEVPISSSASNVKINFAYVYTTKRGPWTFTINLD